MDRLNKVLASAGIGSRRQCDELIRARRVTIDGAVVVELGTRVPAETAVVAVDGQPIRRERTVYWLLNKPRGVLCTNYDPSGRPRAVDLIPHVEQRVYTVGRLDEASEGLLLLTNDGNLAHKLMHPRYGVEKTYLVQVHGDPTPDDCRRLLTGVFTSDGRIRAKRIKRMKKQKESTWLRIVLNEGKNREIRRMLARFGHKVLTLRRIAIGPVKLDRLPRGKARRLAAHELRELQRAVEKLDRQPS